MRRRDAAPRLSWRTGRDGRGCIGLSRHSSSARSLCQPPGTLDWAHDPLRCPGMRKGRDSTSVLICRSHISVWSLLQPGQAAMLRAIRARRRGCIYICWMAQLFKLVRTGYWR
eukprot:scaffold129948_cov33-Tisochrysis_lutea.AAC.1